MIGFSITAPRRRVIAPTTRSATAVIRTIHFILKRPEPNFSTGVGEGMAVARVTNMAGNRQRKSVQQEPKRRRFLVIAIDRGFKVKKVMVREVMFQMMIMGTDIMMTKNILVVMGCQPKLGWRERRIRWVKMMLTANKTTTLNGTISIRRFQL